MKPNSRRIAAAVGALAVAGVTATGVIAGTATAAGTGTCTSSVNVRSEPATTAPIVGVCERGDTTSVGERKDGFVELPEYGGWAVAEYVSTSNSSSPRTGTGSSEDSLSPSGSERSTTPSTGSPRSSGSPAEGTSTEPSADRSASPSSEPSSSEPSSSEPSSSERSSDVESFFSDD